MIIESTTTTQTTTTRTIKMNRTDHMGKKSFSNMNAELGRTSEMKGKHLKGNYPTQGNNN